jgi:hypothetical protein
MCRPGLPRFARNDEVIDGQLFCLERDDIGLHVLNGPATERGPGTRPVGCCV